MRIERVDGSTPAQKRLESSVPPRFARRLNAWAMRGREEIYRRQIGSFSNELEAVDLVVAHERRGYLNLHSKRCSYARRLHAVAAALASVSEAMRARKFARAPGFAMNHFTSHCPPPPREVLAAFLNEPWQGR